MGAGCQGWKDMLYVIMMMLMAFSGDMERQVGVPVTPVCDRNANTVAKIQIGEQNYTLI